MMKVLIINGSPRANGNTSIAVNELVKIFEAEGVETVVSQIGNKDIQKSRNRKKSRCRMKLMTIARS